MHFAIICLICLLILQIFKAKFNITKVGKNCAILASTYCEYSNSASVPYHYQTQHNPIRWLGRG